MTPSVIFSTREISSSVAGSAAKVSRWYVALRLVVDLVGELAPAPGFVRLEAPAAAFDQLAHARDDLFLALLRELGIQHEQDFVVGHAPASLPSV